MLYAMQSNTSVTRHNSAISQAIKEAKPDLGNKTNEVKVERAKAGTSNNGGFSSSSKGLDVTA
jgi:hypothetical protein